MARRHGWGGSPPADEGEARARIIEAAIRCVDRDGPEQFTLSGVAAELGVIRQTVYRYYPSTDELLSAVSQVSVESFLDKLKRHLEPLTRPADWVVEVLAVAIEQLPAERYLVLLLAANRPVSFTQGVVSDVAVQIGRNLAKESAVDWAACGYDGRRLDELIELMLRIIQSMVVTPPAPPRTGSELRGFLQRWLGPAVAATS
jgi:AcrR family transcriptional regulator